MTTWRSADNTAVIFGGGNGIGFAAASQFLSDGMRVLIADKDEDALQNAENALRTKFGDRIVSHPCDVADLEQVESVRDVAFDTFGAVDCVMNNAGVAMRTGDPWENLETWKTIVEINYWGCPSSKHLGHMILFHMGGPGSSRFDFKPLVVDGSSGALGWSVS